ncbi:MAG: helix-turn-helix domain-containing protein [Desulfomonilaceae bacterium]
MDIAERLRELREAKKLSQGDIERRTGLIRSYISRVENGHAVPTVETLEKICQGLQVPIYQVFYDGKELPETLIFSDNGKSDWALRGKGQRLLRKLRHALRHTTEADRRLLLHFATKLASTKRKMKS